MTSKKGETRLRHEETWNSWKNSEREWNGGSWTKVGWWGGGSRSGTVSYPSKTNIFDSSGMLWKTLRSLHQNLGHRRAKKHRWPHRSWRGAEHHDLRRIISCFCIRLWITQRVAKVFWRACWPLSFQTQRVGCGLRHSHGLPKSVQKRCDKGDQKEHDVKGGQKGYKRRC